jgi:hypothetical protein
MLVAAPSESAPSGALGFGAATATGYLVIADISGYSAYLATTELEHSPQVLAELLELIVQHLQPPLQLSKIEGDAVFVHARKGTFLRGETLLEVIENTYVAFRDRIKAIERTMCDCTACRRSPTLDLKFVVHQGRYRMHRVAGNDELVGKDVALAHRLLKNGVGDQTGWRGYALLSLEALRSLGLAPEGVHRSTERYDLGSVDTASLDLDRRYRTLVEARRILIGPEKADVTVARTLAAPPAVAWEWLNDPQRRRRWEDLVVAPQVLPGGRSGIGEVSHCSRGTDVMVTTVLDLRPFEYFTVQSSRPPSEAATVTSYRLIPVEKGRTELQVTVALPGRGLGKRKARRSTERALGRSLDELAAAMADADVQGGARA